MQQRLALGPRVVMAGIATPRGWRAVRPPLTTRPPPQGPLDVSTNQPSRKPASIRRTTTGYDQAVALPAMQAGGDEAMFKENNKKFEVRPHCSHSCSRSHHHSHAHSCYY